MHRTRTDVKIGVLASAALLALAGCNRNVSSAEAPAAAVAPPSQTQPAVDASSASPAEPAVSSMTLAAAPSKMGAPVDLRYQFEGDVKTGQPVTLHLAAVPRVAGSNLTVSLKKEAGINATGSELTAQKASAATAYRQQLSVTKLAGGPSELHVLVMMQVPEGSAHSWFSIPLEGTPAAGKQQPLKLE